VQKSKFISLTANDHSMISGHRLPGLKPAINGFAFTLCGLLILVILGCQKMALLSSDQILPQSISNSIVRVNVTRQIYNTHRPWQQHSLDIKTAIGVVVPGPRVLTTANFLAHQRYIEFEKIGDRQKSGARIEVIDYEANLALLVPVEASFLADLRPMALVTDTVSGDQLSVLQVKPGGSVIPSTGPVTSVDLAAYPYGNRFLAYRLNTSLQFGYGNSTLPVLKGNHLAGLVMGVVQKAQTIDVIAAPIIEHFMADARDGDYRGFPSMGASIGPTTDPQLRKYCRLDEIEGGGYVQEVRKGGPADRAGLLVGDIIIRIGDYDISSTGQYVDPVHGHLSMTHLIRCEHLSGDKVVVHIYRNGELMTLGVTLDHRRADQFLVPPYVIDHPPYYYILGGLVLQELGGGYLRAYGEGWALKAPINLLYYNSQQDNLVDPLGRKKIVFLSGVLPTSYTIGYEDLAHQVVVRINNRIITKLADVPAALQKPLNGFHRIELEDHPGVIYLDPKEIPAINSQIRERYQISQLKHLP
jgi:hypothetical protein